MKTLLRALVCAAVLASLPSIASAQFGYTVSDRDNLAPQELLRFDVNSCGVEQLGPINTNAEQEGLFSVGSMLFGYSEFDPALPNLEERIPATRLLPPPEDQPLGPNPNRPVCTNPAGAFGTESAAAYNPTDGFIYVANSDDTLPAGQIRTRFFRAKPGGCAFQACGTSTQYIDGLAINAQGQGFASDLRITDSAYRFNTATCGLTLIGPLGGAFDEDSGLAWDFENDRLVLLAELGRIFFVNTATGAATLQCTVIFDDDMEGLDIPVASPID